MPAIPWIIAGLATLIIGATVADDVDQRKKRVEEQQRFRREIAKLTTKIAKLEAAHATSSATLAEKNHQVRAMADEIFRLRGEHAKASGHITA